MAAVPATAFLLPIALAITLVKVITLAASLRRLEAKFGGVGGGQLLENHTGVESVAYVTSITGYDL